MAKGRRPLPPKKNIGSTIKNIVKQGPQAQPSITLAKGQTQSFVQQVNKSKSAAPSQNQRGKVLNSTGRDLTR
jgi:hypothetical protein